MAIARTTVEKGDFSVVKPGIAAATDAEF